MFESAGSAEQLANFAEIFFGSLIIALVYFVIRQKTRGLPLPGANEFDWTVTILGLWCFTGMVIDAWGHKHGAVDESFFTPWHAIWYSGFTAFAGFIIHALSRLHGGKLPRNYADLKRFFTSMPPGYSVGVAGMFVFAFAGFGDMLWHTFLGIEGGTDILLSTTHLGLAAGLILTLMTPFWAAWFTPGSGEEGLRSQLPMLLGLGGAWSVLTLFTSFIHPQTVPYSDICDSLSMCQQGTVGLEKGISAIILQAAIMTAVVLLFLRRWKPVAGTFTVLFAINGLAISAFAPGPAEEMWKHMFTPLLAGIVIDFLHHRIQPTKEFRWRLFCFLIPSTHTLVWMLLMTYQRGWDYGMVAGYPVMAPLGWSVHATIGAIFLAGSMGILVGMVTDPPEVPLAKSDPLTS